MSLFIVTVNKINYITTSYPNTRNMIGKYQRIKKLGRGAFGVVFQVKDPATSKEYAAKAVNLDPDDEDAVMAEVSIMKKLRSPYLVSYIEDFKMELMDAYVILMEYCPGGSLAGFIKKHKDESKKVPEERIRKWLIQICQGLHYIHSNKMLHRDIKPANILLDANDMAKIADFGTVRILSRTSSLPSTKGGTQEYESPELCKGLSYGTGVDVWAVGCVMYELCTLEYAYGGVSKGEMVRKICDNNLQPKPIKEEEYSKTLREIIRAMLVKDKDKRVRLDQLLEYFKQEEEFLRSLAVDPETNVDQGLGETQDEGKIKEELEGKKEKDALGTVIPVKDYREEEKKVRGSESYSKEMADEMIKQALQIKDRNEKRSCYVKALEIYKNLFFENSITSYSYHFLG
eukprot:TRINITY_DN1161_c1_g1_i3.p1 TRINITY_DN1161_c1_g1~~TRINITY_DN1161_c1_g1_i3.p1  ORF type:complete len:436 (-),score=48.20 TRINITY_DN1161_c1_g1_i3:47-1249(-)